MHKGRGHEEKCRKLQYSDNMTKIYIIMCVYRIEHYNILKRDLFACCHNFNTRTIRDPTKSEREPQRLRRNTNIRIHNFSVGMSYAVLKWLVAIVYHLLWRKLCSHRLPASSYYQKDCLTWIRWLATICFVILGLPLHWLRIPWQINIYGQIQGVLTWYSVYCQAICMIEIL